MLGDVLPVLRFVPFVFHFRFLNVALFVVTGKPERCLKVSGAGFAGIENVQSAAAVTDNGRADRHLVLRVFERRRVAAAGRRGPKAEDIDLSPTAAVPAATRAKNEEERVRHPSTSLEPTANSDVRAGLVPAHPGADSAPDWAPTRVPRRDST